jgi:nicotinamidase-related amidase
MKKLLIVVDYQKDFVSGSLGFAGAGELADGIVKKIRKYREDGGDVAFTLDTHGSDYLSTQEGRNLPVIHCAQDTDGWRLFGPVADEKRDGDIIFVKSQFGSPELFDFLRNSSFVSIELVGLVSDICVAVNAVLAKTACPEALIVVDASLTDCHNRIMREKALDVLEGLQIQVINRIVSD